LIAVRGLRALRWAALALLGVEFADELASGVPYTTAFAVQTTFDATTTALHAWTFVVPVVFALVAEPYLLLKAEKWGHVRSLRWGVFGMGASLVLGALAPNFETLGVCVAVFFPSSGVACGVAQVLLVEGAKQREVPLTDWALVGWLGDLVTPALFWLLVEAGLSWRWTFALVGLSVVLLVFGMPTTTPRRREAEARNASEQTGADADHGPNDDEPDDDEPHDDEPHDDESHDDEPPLREALRLISGHPTLLWWLFATALCALLDELFASQLGVHSSTQVGPEAVTPLVTSQLIAFSSGGTLGLTIQRWLLRRHLGAALLWRMCAVSLVVGAFWVITLPHAFSLVFALVLGAAVATQYPLVQAQAYAALPGRAGVVAAASQAFTGLELGYPLLVGLLSDTFSPLVGLCALFLQPLGIWTVVYVTRRKLECRDVAGPQ
jgi:MFS family permease